jgi:hypothetical protein
VLVDVTPLLLFGVFVTTPKSGCGSAYVLFIFPLPFKKTTVESQPLSNTFICCDFSPLRRNLCFVFGVWLLLFSEFGFGASMGLLLHCYWMVVIF